MTHGHHIMVWALQAAGIDIQWSTANDRIWRLDGCDGDRQRLLQATQAALMLAIAATEDPFLGLDVVGYDGAAFLVEAVG